MIKSLFSKATSLCLIGATVISLQYSLQAKPSKAKPKTAVKPAAKKTVKRKSTPAGSAASKTTPQKPQPFARINATTRNQSESKETVLVADKGKAILPVVLAPKAAPETKALAQELADQLGKMTGASFEIREGGTGPAIYVGTIAEFPTPSAAEGLKIFGRFDGNEAFAIRTENNSIKLLGATPLGTRYAVTRFLERLGFRWYFQNSAWDIVPKASRVTFNRNETDRPEVLVRSFGYPLGLQFEKDDPDAGAALLTWWRHNYVGRSFETRTGHAAYEIRTMFKDEFEKHPEYTALVNGKRTPGQWGQLCLSNPGLQKLAAKFAQNYFDKHPEAVMVGIGPDDGGGYCTCDVCKKTWPNPGDGAFHLANVAAKALQQTHPGKFVGLYAYNWHCDPPPFQLEPNVYVELTTAMLLNTKYGFEELLDLWPQRAKYFGIYDYWAVYDWIRDTLPSGRTGNLNYVAEKLPFYIKKGISVLVSESGTSWGSQGLGYYLASRVLWDSTSDTVALRKDFLEKAFGPAAAEMDTYYKRIDTANAPLLGPAFYRLCLDDLERAEKAAQGNAEVLTRIEQLKQYHVFVYLYNRHAARRITPAEQKPWALEMSKWNYRIRNSYMTFWDFYADQTTNRFAREFEEPTWSWHGMRSQGKADQIPYRVMTGVPTREETASWFQKAKEYYGEVRPVTEVKFSNDLVAVEWPESKPENIPPYLLQGGQYLAIEAKANEPLRFKVAQSTIYPDTMDGKYTVTDTSGKQIATGRVAKIEPQMVEVKVPKPGVYFVRYDDDANGWNLFVLPGQRSAFVLERKAAGRITAYRGSFAFYVPKGTKTIEMYANRDHPFIFRTPDGQTVGNVQTDVPNMRTISHNGSYISLQVPEGSDGKVWHASDMIAGHFYFFNIPNILLTSNEGPLLPREVAERDGLKIRN